METVKRSASTPSLNIAYEQTGPESGQAVVLLHGFPYGVRQYDKVRDGLAGSDRRIVVPWLRGFGATQYKSENIVRSGQQAALGKDVVDLLDDLGIHKAILVGYDWGGRAACVAAALWPERVRGLVSASGYAIQDINQAALKAVSAQTAHALWYQSYFNTRQGEIGLSSNREEFWKFLWKLWSPTWNFSDVEYAQTAESFHNPDFVATVIQSYRHHYRNDRGDPGLDDLENRLAQQPDIAVNTIALHGADDRVEPPCVLDGQERHFRAGYQQRILREVGHCLPAEAPTAVCRAVEELLLNDS